MSGLPQGVLQFAALKDAEPEEPSEIAELAEWLFGRGQFPVLDGVDTELLGIEVHLPVYPLSIFFKHFQVAGSLTKSSGRGLGIYACMSLTHSLHQRGCAMKLSDMTVHQVQRRTYISKMSISSDLPQAVASQGFLRHPL